MKLGTQVGFSLATLCQMGTQLPLPQRGTAPPNFRPIFVVAKWLHGSRCHLVWSQASAQATSSERTVTVRISTTKQQFVLIFLCGEWHPTLLWPNGWMDEDATWYGSRPPHRPHCIRRFPSTPRKGHSTPPLFQAMSTRLWPWSPISATAELLYSLLCILCCCISCLVHHLTSAL